MKKKKINIAVTILYQPGLRRHFIFMILAKMHLTAHRQEQHSTVKNVTAIFMI